MYKMPAKPVKKTVVKKKTVKKEAVKKTVKPATSKESVKTEPVPEMVMCKCGKRCECGENCKCVRRGSKCGRFMLKLIIVLIIFALGFAAAKFVDGKCFYRGPRVAFDNGCLDVSSVKCPKMQAVLPMMDIDRDGCITREEYRAIKKELGRQMRTGNAMMRD